MVRHPSRIARPYTRGPAAVFCAAALLALAAPVWAQPDEPPAEPPAVDAPTQGQAPDAPPDKPTYTREDRLAQLAHEDYAIRAAATAALLQDDTIDPPALAQLLQQASHPEQVVRLIRIAEHHLMRHQLEEIADQLRGDGPPDRASVGFAYAPILPEQNPHGQDAAVAILDTMPGFPGYAYLLPGDVILAIDGQSSRSATIESVRRWVGLAIGRHQAGDTLTLTLHRQGQTLELTLPCAGINALNAVYTTTGNGQTVRAAPYQDVLEQQLKQLTDNLPPDAQPLEPAE